MNRYGVVNEEGCAGNARTPGDVPGGSWSGRDRRVSTLAAHHPCKAPGSTRKFLAIGLIGPGAMAEGDQQHDGRIVQMIGCLSTVEWNGAAQAMPAARFSASACARSPSPISSAA